MSKHKHGETVVAENQEVAQEVASEQPKTKVGDKVETVVDGKSKAVRAPKVTTYRILDGVDAAKFSGQRKAVVLALQKLDAMNPGNAYSLEEIVQNVEGLVSKTPVEASVKYHLLGLVKDKQVEGSVPATPAATEKPATAAA